MKRCRPSEIWLWIRSYPDAGLTLARAGCGERRPVQGADRTQQPVVAKTCSVEPVDLVLQRAVS